MLMQRLQHPNIVA
jgi:NIMA (never in mitosis gene a)-related kinase 1/4/5